MPVFLIETPLYLVIVQVNERTAQPHFTELLQVMTNCLTGSDLEKEDLARNLPIFFDSLFKLDRCLFLFYKMIRLLLVV